MFVCADMLSGAARRLMTSYAARLRSRRFNVAAAVSLLLLVATVVMWVRSYHVEEYWSEWNAPRATRAGFNLGRVVLWRVDFTPPTAVKAQV